MHIKIIFLTVIIILAFLISKTYISKHDNKGISIEHSDIKHEKVIHISKSSLNVNNTKSIAQGRSTKEELSLKLQNFFKRHSCIDEKSNYISDLIEELCKNGNTDLAFDIIDDHAGQLRDFGLFTFFSKASLSNDELLRLLEDQDPRDFYVSFDGILSRFSTQELLKFISSSNYSDFMNKNKKNIPAGNIEAAIAGNLDNLVNGRPKNEVMHNMNLIAELAKSKIVTEWNAYQLINSNKTISSFEKWDLLKNLEITNQIADYEISNFAQESKKKLINEIIRSDADRAMKLILENDSADRFTDINNAITSWINIDSLGVSNWYRNNVSVLSHRERDTIAYAFSTNALNSAEYDGSLWWANQIQDVVLKDQVTKKIIEMTTVLNQK